VRGGDVAAGVGLMLVGAFLLFFLPGTGFTAVGGSSGSNPISDSLMGLVVGFIGFIVLIAGLAASPDARPQTVYVQQAPPSHQAPGPTYGAPTTSPPSEVGHSNLASTQPPAQKWTPPSAITEPSRPSGTSDNPVVPPVQSHVTLQTRAFCPYCGARGSPDFRFCRSCGREQPKE
jgi:hypothetical protein